LDSSGAILKPQPLLLVDGSGLVRQCSRSFAESFFPLEPGTPLASIITAEQRDEFRQWLGGWKHSRGGTIQLKNFRLLDKSGRSFLVSLQPESFSDGHYLLFCGEAEKPRSAANYWESALTPAMEAVFSSILDGVFILDTEARVMEVNQALCLMLGYHKFELLGLPVGVFFASGSEEIQKATLRFARIMKHGKAQELHLELLQKSGEKLEVSFNGAVIRGEGSQLVGILGTVRDLRESRLMRDLKQKTSELEKAMEQLSERDRAKDDFLSVVGHELRTPLANILGYSEFLLEGELKPSEKKEFISVVYQESRRLARLVNEILDLSRLEAGKLIYHYVLQPIDPILKESAEAVRAEAENKKIKISQELGYGQELWLDRDRIKQVVINLLNNAIKYSEPGTETRLESKAIENGVLVSVADQGMGIAPENHEKVFEKFGRVQEVEHHTQGAGLGLPIAKRIIEEGHGGRLWLESPGLGQGSTFYFWLPKSVKHEA
jgi:PAS domain S-box-containing protein